LPQGEAGSARTDAAPGHIFPRLRAAWTRGHLHIDTGCCRPADPDGPRVLPHPV